MKKTILINAWVLVFSMLSGISIGCNAGEHNANKGFVKTDSTTILENGSYFNGKTFVPFKEIIIKDGKIAAISNSISNETGQRISVSGKYVIPGLIDAHEHISGAPTYPFVFIDPVDNLKSNLHCGVTTVIDLFYPEDGCKEVKLKVGSWPGVYSSVIMSGPILTAPGGHGTEYGVPTRTITSVEEAGKITNEVIDNGADVIKAVYEAYTNKHSINKAMLKEIVAVAHKRNKKVFVHIDDAAGAMDCVDAGVDVLAHMPGDELTDDQLRKIKKSGIVVIPTITVYQSLLEGFDGHYMSDSLLWATANPAYLETFSRNALPKPPIPDSIIQKIYQAVNVRGNLANCIKMNIPILAGTDAGNYAVFYGYSLHNEMLQYIRGGMSPAQALCSATENISYVFPNLKTGKIKEGYDADLVVLGSDPLKNIENTKDIKMVIHKGTNVDMTVPLFEKQNKVTEKITAESVFDPAVLSIDNMSNLPSYITSYTDNVVGGSSELNIQLQKEATGANYIHLTGKVVKKGNTGFTGISFILSRKLERYPAPVDISDYKAISFDVKGNGETYYVVLHSSLVKDYSYHTASYKAQKEWQTITIPFNDLKQYYGKQIPLDTKTIQAVTFQASGKDYSIDLELKNIHLVK